VDTLSFAGHYKAADFRLQSDGSKGTDVIYAGTQAHDFGSVAPWEWLAWHEVQGDAATGSLAYWHDGEAATAPWHTPDFLTQKLS
jgi:hypothetical protein